MKLKPIIIIVLLACSIKSLFPNVPVEKGVTSGWKLAVAKTTWNWRNLQIIVNNSECRYNSLTWTLASVRSSLMASSSLVNTSGYCVFSKADSKMCSWYVVKVVRDLRTFLGLGSSISSELSFELLMVCFPSSALPPICWIAKFNSIKLELQSRRQKMKIVGSLSRLNLHCITHFSCGLNSVAGSFRETAGQKWNFTKN